MPGVYERPPLFSLELGVVNGTFGYSTDVDKCVSCGRIRACAVSVRCVSAARGTVRCTQQFWVVEYYPHTLADLAVMGLTLGARFEAEPIALLEAALKYISDVPQVQSAQLS